MVRKRDPAKFQGMGTRRIKRKQHGKLSFQAEALLGLLITLADEEGCVEATRAELAKARSVSVPTIARALRELVEAGELELEVPGGGRGRPSRYRITRLSRETVSQPSGCGGSAPEKPRDGELNEQAAGKKPYHNDPVHDPDQHALVKETFGELGRTVVLGAAAFLDQAAEAWRTLPAWQRGIIVGAPLGLLGFWLGKRYGGWQWGVIGALLGIATSIYLAPVIPQDEGTAQPQTQKDSHAAESERPVPPLGVWTLSTA